MTIALLGFGVGIMVGVTGSGGAAIMTPLLILLFGVEPITAVGTDIAYSAVTKSLGGYRQWRAQKVDLSVCRWFATGSVPGAIAAICIIQFGGVWYGNDKIDRIILIATTAVLLVSGCLALLQRWMAPKPAANAGIRSRKDKLVAVACGLVLGFIVVFTSTGSGALAVVMLIAWFRLPVASVVGSSVFHAAILLSVAAVGHVLAADVDFGLALNILVGSIPGLLVGMRLANNAPGRVISGSLAFVLLASGLATARKVGVAIPLVWVFVIPIALALAFAVPRGHRSDSPAQSTAA